MLKSLLALFLLAQVNGKTNVPTIYNNFWKNRNHTEPTIIPQNNCVSFSISQGTGCAWMCSYCADKLGPNYYFTDNVCKYQNSGCVGNPLAGVTYTCCSM
jgi:hypothetical protein